MCLILQNVGFSSVRFNSVQLTRWIFVGKVMSLVFNMLSRLIRTFLPRSKHLLISWLQSPSAVILEPKKIKPDTVSTVSPSISHEVMGPDAMIFVFWMLSFKSNHLIREMWNVSLPAVLTLCPIGRCPRLWEMCGGWVLREDSRPFAPCYSLALCPLKCSLMTLNPVSPSVKREYEYLSHGG